MKYLLMIVAVVMVCAAPALAADQGNLSQNSMAKMGLSGMSVMSDAQGTAVRGMGFSKAWGSSWAAKKGTGSDNAYFAVDKGKKGSLAGGANLSFAGKGTLNAGLAAGDIALGSKVIFAGGGSIAFTK